MFRIILIGSALSVNVGVMAILGWGIYGTNTSSMNIGDAITMEQQAWQELTWRYGTLVSHRQLAELLERHANLLTSFDRPVREATSPAGKPSDIPSLPGLARPIAQALYCDAWIIMGMAAGSREGPFFESDHEACTVSELAGKQGLGGISFWKTEIAHLRSRSDAEITAVKHQADESNSKLELLRKRLNLWSLSGMFVAIFILFHSAILSVDAIATSIRKAT
ncbi:MAG: hypothetical protein OXF33_09050 [Rhodospirillales bacterium]|nr:hypothetical protein [Rhodospirillales bacterium]